MTCELQKCGHCKSLEEDDQCGRPEHRFCMYCALKSTSDDSDTWASKLHDAIEAALKELEAVYAGHETSVSNAIGILKKAANL